MRLRVAAPFAPRLRPRLARPHASRPQASRPAPLPPGSHLHRHLLTRRQLAAAQRGQVLLDGAAIPCERAAHALHAAAAYGGLVGLADGLAHERPHAGLEYGLQQEAVGACSGRVAAAAGGQAGRLGMVVRARGGGP
jgi:hypothetical protein